MAFQLEKIIPILERTPSILKTFLENLDPDWMHQHEGENTWSPYDIIGHLIHGEKTDWIPRTKQILDSTYTDAFEPFDRFAQFENSKGKTLEMLLEEFMVLRAENIDILKSLALTQEGLTKKGRHPELGTVTLKNLLAAWTIHDLSHINQITRVMAKDLKNDVGPWETYLTVIKS
ncbi:DinB family protein [uncultured Dokdonia sp.]|uniref:DinB family protein n=1 Tax=uncultured Dokdonia sp. TaxID=575653 RepID=UPI0026019823|nr:DinB family protein [uncultured Dokdonia sp.]